MIPRSPDDELLNLDYAVRSLRGDSRKMALQVKRFYAALSSYENEGSRDFDIGGIAEHNPCALVVVVGQACSVCICFNNPVAIRLVRDRRTTRDASIHRDVALSAEIQTSTSWTIRQADPGPRVEENSDDIAGRAATLSRD